MNKNRHVIERLLAMVYVLDTSAISLKDAIDYLFAKHRLSFPRLRGQGYDRASSMRGEFNDLKALIFERKSICKICLLFCSPTTISDYYRC